MNVSCLFDTMFCSPVSVVIIPMMALLYTRRSQRNKRILDGDMYVSPFTCLILCFCVRKRNRRIREFLN